MKLFTKLRNKCFTAICPLALLVMASIGLFNLCGSPRSVEASMVKFDNEKSITISNGSFTSFSSSSQYPYSINSYSTSGNSTPSMKTGAINISEKTYANNYEKYGLTEYGNPKGVGTDNYVLMINTKEDSDYTYTSSEFTLPANGNYYVTVSAKTIGDSSIASVFLMQNDTIFKDCIIQNITTKAWNNYTFFVTTNAYESVTLKFGMQIGSQSSRASGCVLFDELHAGQISNDTLRNCLNNFSENTFKYIEFRSPNMYKAYNFDNQVQVFAKDSEGNNVPTPVVDTNYFATSTSGGGHKTVDIDNGVITISTDDTYAAYEGQEEILQPNSTYRFAIKAKASEVKSGSAFVKLEEILDDEDKYEDFMGSDDSSITAKTSTLSITSKTSNSLDSDYVEHIIYVNTGALQTSKVKFSFGVGLSNSKAKATVSFKEFTIERVPYSAYSGASTSDTLGKIDIAERISLNSNEYSNYTFDKMQSESFDGVQYPAVPTSWTKANSGNGYQLSGVVNLSQFKAMMDKYSNEINQLATPASIFSTNNNNVLMIYNGANSVQSYTSTSKALTANRYYKVTAFVNTHMWDADAHGVTVVAKTNSVILGKVENVKTGDNWQRIELYINTPATDIELTLELSLGYGNKTSSGYAFFDNIMVEEAEKAGDFTTQFDKFLVAQNGSTTIDLTNTMLASTSTRDYNIPVLYTGSNYGSTTVNAGIVNTTDSLSSIIAESKMQALRDGLEGDNRNVLAISTALNKDSRYEFTSVIPYNFESGKYYKMSFQVYTDNISQEDKEEKYDGKQLAQGANVELTGLEKARFSYIVSDGKWTTYEYYIGLDSTVKANLVFGLGSTFTGCYGRAFLGNIKVEEVQEADFKAVESGDKILKVDTVKETEEEKESSTKSDTNFDWAYIPTILTFLAIVVAIVGVFVRRNIKFKKHVGNKKANYDRDITVIQNKYRRLASDARDKEVRELTKECEELMAMRVEYEEKYKDALNRLRSARLANRDGSKRHEIAAIEREVKHISKEVARFGVQINNYENEIEFMKTEAYLIDIEKRMMREDNSTRNQLRKEAEMSEEDRAKSVAKREQKQARIEAKEEQRAEKWAQKQAELEEERLAVQAQLAAAIELDERLAKEQELRQIKLEEERLAREKAKEEQEMARQAKLAEKQDQTAEEQSTPAAEEETTDSADETSEPAAETAEEKQEDTTDTAEQSEQTSATAETTETTAEVEQIVEPQQMVEPVETTENVETAKTENVEEAAASETAETVSEPALAREVVETETQPAAETTENAQNTQTAEQEQTTENVENTEVIEQEKAVETAEQQSAETAEQPVENTETEQTSEQDSSATENN